MMPSGGQDKSDKPNSVFKTLSGINVAKYIKTLQSNRYIAWSDAWNEVKKIYPFAYYVTHEDTSGNPFFASDMGIFIKVTVHIESEQQTLFYPVMNGANKALKKVAYSYKVKDYVNSKWNGKYIDKYVEPANSFDINTAIMRGLTKCLALMGMALYIYRDEPTPDAPTLNSAELQEIMNRIKEKQGLTTVAVAEAWQVEKIAHILSMHYLQMLDWIEEQP